MFVWAIDCLLAGGDDADQDNALLCPGRCSGYYNVRGWWLSTALLRPPSCISSSSSSCCWSAYDTNYVAGAGCNGKAIVVVVVHSFMGAGKGGDTASGAEGVGNPCIRPGRGSLALQVLQQHCTLALIWYFGFPLDLKIDT